MPNLAKAGTQNPRFCETSSNRPSKGKALEHLEEAYRRAPGNLYNRQYLAEVLYDQGEPGRARELMETVVGEVETDQGIEEDAFIKRQAREILSRWDEE